MKRIVAIHVGDIRKYPPAISVLCNSVELNYDVHLIVTSIDMELKILLEKKNITVHSLEVDYEKNVNLMNKYFRMNKLKKMYWKKIEEVYDNKSIIWVFSDLAIKHLGRKLVDYQYILHMFELAKNNYYHRKLKYPVIDTGFFARHAKEVIQAEYNRAQISKAWWGLDGLPTVYPNKPYDLVQIKKNNEISDETVRRTIHKLKEKKIILYQGIISDERPLDIYLEALELLPEEYVLVVMGKNNPFHAKDSDRYYFIPFINAPHHLEVTSHAHIGILSYYPTNNEYSKLNSIYCAPNKLYEYAKFGIPMIGNNIPGLVYTINNRVGQIHERYDALDVAKAILEIEKNYKWFSSNSIKFYEETDSIEIIKKVIEGND